MQIEFSDLHTWRDIKDAEISSEELEIINEFDLIKQEIDTVFTNISDQILKGEDVNVYYYIPYTYYKKNIEDGEIRRAVIEYYASKLREIYDNILLSFFNLTFYQGAPDFDLDTHSKYFETFYSLHYGENAVESFYRNMNVERFLSFIRLDKYSVAKSMIIGYYDAKIFSLKDARDNLEELLKSKKLKRDEKKIIRSEIKLYNQVIDIMNEWRASISISDDVSVCNFYKTYFLGEGG